MPSLDPIHQAKRIAHKFRRTQEVVSRRLSVANNYDFSIDNPRKKVVEIRQLEVEGWIIPHKNKSFTLRVRNNDKIYEVETGLKRLDVAKAYPDYEHDLVLHSGFRATFVFEDGDITLELNEGKGFKKLYHTPIQHGLENLPAAIYNKDLSNNFPEHINLIENRQKFYYEDSLAGKYIRDDSDPRLMAIYLPQFHPFPENNKAWGDGFTEWTNVTTGQPRFIGHQQPILPKDLGFYDLRLESNIQQQIELAKKYGVYGFCFYYYWFSGRKLMQGPLESFIKHKEWDFNFAICWANENWTKRWDGRDNDIIIAQEYLDDDPLHFIKDIEHILLDKRYVCEGDKPVLMVYRASELKEPARYAAIWREYFRKQHKRELQLVSYLSFDDQDPREYDFDAALDFAPLSAFFKSKLFENSHFPYIDVTRKLLDVNFSGVVADYRSIALNGNLSKAYSYPAYQCLTPSWDNDARKKGNGFVYQNSSPDLYSDWLKRLIVQEKHQQKAPLIFINAWNEWAEGAIMEPSMHLGHSVLNRTVEVMSSESANPQNNANFPAYGIKRRKGKKLAVVVHLYYIDLWPEIRQSLELIEEPFDLFVTLNELNRDFETKLDKDNVMITTFILPNRGRDVLPFLFLARRLRSAGYEYVLKLHSKKSKHRADGSSWFDEVLKSLLPSQKDIAAVIATLKDKNAGIVGPEHHLVSLKRHMGSNRQILEHLLTRLYGHKKAAKVLQTPERYPYFGGTMFWTRLDMLDDILNLQLMPDDFQSEHAQIDGTTAHALERLFGIICKIQGRSMYEVSEKGVVKIVAEILDEKYRYAP
jgi:lipopolysaccharide biosynthesis protein